MEYRIQRQGQIYGPYTEAEVRQYLAAGNIVETDLARTPDMKKFRPLQKVLPKEKKPVKTNLRVEGFRTDISSPPDIPWILALILEVSTSFTFFLAWDVVEAVWLYRVRPSALRPLVYSAVAGALVGIEAPAIVSEVKHVALSRAFIGGTLATLLVVFATVLRILGRLSMRSELLAHYNETEAVGLELSKWKTLLLGGLYFQFHFNRINELKRVQATKPALP